MYLVTFLLFAISQTLLGHYVKCLVVYDSIAISLKPLTASVILHVRNTLFAWIEGIPNIYGSELLQYTYLKRTTL